MARVNGAMVLATTPGAAAVVAGLPLAVRTVLALREAGFEDVGLMASDEPGWAVEPLARRGVSVRWVTPTADGSRLPENGRAPTLFLAGDTLVDVTAVAPLRDAGPGLICTASGQAVGEVRSGEEAAGALNQAGHASGGGMTRIRTGLAMPLGEAGSPARLERALLDHVSDRASNDSYLAAVLDRPLSRVVTRFLLRTPLTPTHVTVLGVAFGCLGALGLATVSYWGRLVGVLLLIVSLVLDCVDGDLARARLAENPTGARLDVIGDYLVNLAVFAALAIGLLREGLPPGGGLTALALVSGVGAAMAAVHVLFIQPALRRGGDLHWAGDAGSLRGKPGASVLEKLASRDYTYLLLLLAIAGHLEWFLYAAAGGAWLFAAGVVAYALAHRRRAKGGTR